VIALLVITDGRRDCIEQTIASANANLIGPITSKVIVNDSGDEADRLWLASKFPEFAVIHHKTRLGFAQSINTAWAYLRRSDERFVFHLEDDFTFNREIPLRSLARILDREPGLVQIALRRQPWNDAEKKAGGIVEQHPDAYTERLCDDGAWLEQRLFFTTNPSLYRVELCRLGWPIGPHSEGHFSHQLLADPALRFGYWGSRDSGEAVTHIGHVRAGTGY